MTGLFVKRVGQGPRLVLLHGGVLAGELCWRRQLRLADRLALEVVDRAGYGRSQQVSPGEAVLSLTLCEPVAFQVAPGSAEAQQMACDLEEHLQTTGDGAECLRAFLAIVGRSAAIPRIRLP